MTSICRPIGCHITLSTYTYYTSPFFETLSTALQLFQDWSDLVWLRYYDFASVWDWFRSLWSHLIKFVWLCLALFGLVWWCCWPCDLGASMSESDVLWMMSSLLFSSSHPSLDRQNILLALSSLDVLNYHFFTVHKFFKERQQFFLMCPKRSEFVEIVRTCYKYGIF